MRFIIHNTPNALTLGNLVSGCIGISFALNGEIQLAIQMILLCAFFDLLDGAVARMLKVSSEIGGQLDSLADVVSFGVLPSMLFFQSFIQFSPFNYCSFLIAAFAAVRLAIFNLDTEQTTYFKGIPSPAAALIVISILLNNSILFYLKNNLFVFLLVVIVISALMVVKIPFFSFKLKGKWTKNILQLSIIPVTISLLIVFKLEGIVYIMAYYVASNIILFVRKTT